MSPAAPTEAIKYITAGARRRSLHRRYRRGLCAHPRQCRPLRRSDRRHRRSSRPRASAIPVIDRGQGSARQQAAPGPLRRQRRRPAPPRCSTRVGVAFARDGTSDVSLVLLRLGALSRSAATTRSRWSSASSTTAPASTRSPTPSTTRCPPASPLKPMAIVRVADNLDAMGDRPERHSPARATSSPPTPTTSTRSRCSATCCAPTSSTQAAADAYTKALAVTGGTTPGDWRFYYVRGIAYERSDEFPLAEKDFLEALDLNPEPAAGAELSRLQLGRQGHEPRPAPST